MQIDIIRIGDKMKSGIHPKLSNLTVEFDGVKHIVPWTGKEESIKPNLYPGNHPAWTRDYTARTEGGRADKFTQRFAMKK